MKTIRFYRPHGGHVARVSDGEASAHVSAKRAMYCPKHWWRAALKKEASGDQ